MTYSNGDVKNLGKVSGENGKDGVNGADGLGIKSVSYTHLDVYKRQLLVGNGIALALQLVLMGKSWVKGGNELLGGLS